MFSPIEALKTLFCHFYGTRNGVCSTEFIILDISMKADVLSVGTSQNGKI